jgi:dipeptidyl aminopeptidase/acylaminoacyl peptidase
MLTVDSIMRGPKLVGVAPTAVRWSKDSSKVYFTWQKPDETRPATYAVNRDGSGLRQLSTDEARALDVTPAGRFDRAHRRVLAVESGDVVMYDTATGARRQVTRTSAIEASPRWARHDTAATFVREGNLFLVSLDATDQAAFVQLTDVVAAADGPAVPGAAPQRGVGGGRGGARGAGAAGVQTGQGVQTVTGETAAQRILREEELRLIDHFQRQAEETGRGGAGRGALGPPSEPIARVQLGPRQVLADLQLSGDDKYVWIGVTERPDGAARNQDVPNYVTESAYPEMIPGRTNVGDVQSRRLLGVLELKTGKTDWLDASGFAGFERKARPGDSDTPRIVDWGVPDVSDDGAQTVVAVRSQDNKDRWFVKLDPASAKTTVIDNLHDDAWIREQGVGGTGGGGLGTGIAWLPDNKRFLFLSEQTGWMQLYSLDLTAPAPQPKALTSGRWEITDARLSKDRQTVFLTTNEVHPGERHFYTMSVDGGAMTRVTSMTGSNEATVSPDEKTLAIIYSYTIKPPELYLMPFQAGAAARQVTTTPTDEWRSFKWIDPKIITYKTRDGAEVYARLFTPEMLGAKRDPRKPGVVFVHGAGYLQEAHKYWSTSYYRENMFNNLLASRGYVVLDPDYRASAGYGRDWRTAIYRHMGGKDLEDVVDGAKFLVQTEKVDPKRIGVYGGSYGGFITLMAMFTTPDAFAAGAALRPVTDWSHYNHGYTSNILNVPQNDLEAYRQSSPIYFAEGLKGRLLICQGMVDTNVFFQDSVRLIQRLIELRKEHWSIAPYPVENHTFTEETSWADEYRRILSLFEETLRK